MRFTEIVKSVDLFGVELKINLKSKEKTGTIPGGIISTLSLVGLLAYLGILINKIGVHTPTLKIWQKIRFKTVIFIF